MSAPADEASWVAEVYDGAAAFSAMSASHIWQATVFAVLVMALAGTLHGAPARLRYNLYLLAPVKFLLPSALLLVFVGRFGDGFGALIPVGFAAMFDLQNALGAGLKLLGLPGGGHSSAGPPSPLWVWALAIWALGALALGLGWYRRATTFRRHLRSGKAETAGRALERLEVQRRRLGLRREVHLLSSTRISVPGVWGIRKPTIILPESMAENLESDELDAVLLHELIHVERRDNLVGNVLLALRCLLWFHPLMWWLDRRLLAERERACDERVIEVAGNSEAYLRGLAKVLRFGLGARWAGVSFASGSDLQRRIRRLRAQVVPSASPLHRGVWLVALALMFASSLGAVRLCAEGSGPVQAQAPIEVLQDAGTGDGIDPQLLPSQVPWPSRAACVKKPVRTAAKSSGDCDGLRRM